MAPPAIRSSVRDQLTVLHLDGAHAQLAAAIQGAHVLEWTPAGHQPVLYTSPRSQFQPGKPIRGGIPLCFPWFGPKADAPAAPAHGFARLQDWVLQTAEVATDGSARLVFAFASNPATHAFWPHEFSARLHVRANHHLHVALEVGNTGSEAFTFAAALHTYFAVGDVRRIAIRGLEGTAFLDRAGGGSIRRPASGAPLTFAGEVNRIYLDTTATCVVDDPVMNRRIHIAKSGSRSTVVWNPAADVARTMADLGEDAWPGFVCVETCNVAEDTVTLAPRTTHTLAAEIWAEPAP